jgi:hypothetical protein
VPALSPCPRLSIVSTFIPAARELRNASGPEEKKTLERQIKDQDDLINRYQADLTKRGG